LLTLIKESLGNLNFICLLLIIFAFITYVRIPTKHIEDMLSVITAILPQHLVTFFPDTLYKFQQIFEIILKPEFRRISYCTKCFQVYEQHGIQSCCNEFANGTFVLFDLKSVIELKLKSQEFCSDLLKGIIYSRNSEKERLQTICDGRVIQEFRKYVNILYPLTSLSFSIYIDGVSAFKSSKASIVPSK